MPFNSERDERLATAIRFIATMRLTAAVSHAQERPILVGSIGLDTSHAVAFTLLRNDPSRPSHMPGARVVAALEGGSPDIGASATRSQKFMAELRNTWKIELVDSLDDTPLTRPAEPARRAVYGASGSAGTLPGACDLARSCER